MQNKIRTYVSAVGAGALVTAFVLYMWEPAVSSAHFQAALCFATLGLLAHALRHQLAKEAAGSIGFVPFLATAIIAPDWIALATVACSVAVAEAMHKRDSLKAVFNVAQHTLALALAIFSYRVLGGSSIQNTSGLTHALPYAAASVVFIAANTLTVSGVIAISQSRRVWQVWKENTTSSLAYDVLSLPVAYLFGRVYVQFGPVYAVMLAIPLLGVRQLYKTNWQLQQITQELLQLMVAAIEARDPYTSGHSKRVSNYAKLIARAAHLSAKEVERIGMAGLLHDVGKIHEVYAAILRKPDRLTSEERAIMETHPIKSAELVQNVSQLRDLVLPIRHHHENWDGTGYPDGLAGPEIPLAARIIMLADTVDAMTSDRPYRNALDEAAVRAEIARLCGKQFDPELCDLILKSRTLANLVPHRSSMPTPSRSMMRLGGEGRQAKLVR